MADCKGDGRTVRTKKTQVGYRQTLRRTKQYRKEYIDGLLWSQNLLIDNFETHHEATGVTANPSAEHFPQSLASATPSLRNELNGNKNLLAVEVGIGETGMIVNNNIHVHPYLASATTLMSPEFKSHTTDNQYLIEDENIDWEKLMEDNDSYNRSLSESPIPDDYINDWLANLNDENIDVSHEEAVRRSLAEWVLDCNIPRAHVSNLLKRLNRDAGLAYLPLDSRTLLKSVRSRIQCRVVEPGYYYNFGISSTLGAVLALLNSTDIPNVLQLIWNIDGLPLVKSSGNSFWPIVGKLYNVEYAELIVVGVFCGIKKPNCINDFLQEFVTELLDLQKNGFEFHGRLLKIETIAMVFDAPARSFATSIVPHNSYHCCHKCTTKGVWVRNKGKHGGRVSFPDLNAPARIDALFRQRTGAYVNHFDKKKRRSVIESVLSDMVKNIPLDYMHLVCLGVQKKSMSEWVRGKFDRVRLRPELVTKVSQYLVAIKGYIPSEFPRKTRTLDDFPHMKATEHRLHLLYIDPVAFMGILPSRVYKHFLLLHVAIKLLVHPVKCIFFAEYARGLLRAYVQKSKKIYNEAFITYNVHNLIHLPDDVLLYGNLDRFSAFPFENKLQTMKHLLRHSAKPLEQLVRRLHEIEMNVYFSPDQPYKSSISLSNPHRHGPLPTNFHPSNTSQFSVFSWGKWITTTKVPNNCAMLYDHTVILIRNIIRDPTGTIYLIGNKYCKQQNLFVYPLPSIDIQEIVVSELSSIVEAWPISSMDCKMMIIPMQLPENGFFFVSPLCSSSFSK